MSRIPWKRRTYALVHFGLSGPFIRCLYSWGFTISGCITPFIRTGWIVTSSVVLLVCAHSSPAFWTDYVWTALLGGLSGWNVAMWLSIRSWPCILLSLLLYLFTGGMLPDFLSYWCFSGAHASVSSGMTWGLV